MGALITSDNAPQVFEDRLPVTLLASLAPDLYAAMKKERVGKVGEKDRVHFCGLVCSPEVGIASFIPREASTGDQKNDLKTAANTMKALARFGSETSTRDFETDGETGNPHLLSVIAKLADDFKKFGIFSERERIRTRNAGKTDWKRTITGEQAFPDNDGRPVYLDFRTSRPKNHSGAILSQIQAGVIREIEAAHGWWLDMGKARASELRDVTSPRQKRSAWSRQISAILPRLYSRRSIFLAEHLKYYLDNSRQSDSGTFFFGLTDFHAVWETMLRETLCRPDEDSGRNWNRELPHPEYSNATGSNEKMKGMITDIILEGNNHYSLIDAKYYAAKSAKTAPGLPDIAKQQFYELGLRTLVGSRPTIDNCFVFPSKDGSGPLTEVGMYSESGALLPDFPKVRCAYLKAADVLAAYVGRTKSIEVPAPERVNATTTAL